MHADVSDLTSHPPGRDLEMRDGRPLLRVAAHGGGACPAELVSASGERVGHLRVTVAPAPSSASLALSAVALSTFSTTAFGAASTSSLASFRPREVRARTSLMTLIFLSPAASRMTSKESFSSPPAASPPAPPAAGAAATATGAAAVTSKVSSNCFTNSESSMRVISLNASSSSSVLSFAMMWRPFCNETPRGSRWESGGSALGDVGLDVLGVRLGRGGLVGGCLLGGLGGGSSRSQDRRIGFGLRLQRREGAGRLRQRGVEEPRGLGQVGLEATSELGEEDLARLEVGQLVDLVRAERLPIEEAALQDERGVSLREVAQTLRRIDRIARDEGDRGGAGEHRLVELDSGVLGGDLGQRVLGDGIARGIAKRAPQILQLLDVEAAVLGEHRAVGLTEVLREIGDGGCLVRA